MVVEMVGGGRVVVAAVTTMIVVAVWRVLVEEEIIECKDRV